MTAAFEVRDARDGDRAAIVALLRDAALPVDGIDDARFAVAEAGDAVVGCAALEIRGDAGLLRSVAVSPEWRGRGVGEMLVRTILDQAAQCRLDAVVLLTTTAPAWFPRFGFERIDRARVPAGLRSHAEFTGACPESAVVMRCAPGVAALVARER